MDNKENDKSSDIIDNSDIGKRIREQRKKHKLSREQLAEKLNLSVNFLGQIERQERSFSVETMLKLSQELDISLDYLLRGKHNNDDLNKMELIQIIDKLSNQQIKILLDLAKSLQKNN